MLVGLLLFSASCNRSATPGGGGKQRSSQTPCNIDRDCKVSGEACDLFVAPAASSQDYHGMCLKKCTVSTGNAPECNSVLLETCSPITGFCEQTCAGEGSGYCATYLNTSSTSAPATCVSGKYCALVDTSPGSGVCPSVYSKGAGGFCKLKCQSDSECSAVAGQTCDPITGTCEQSCDPTSSTSCTSPTYSLTGQTAPTLSCSQISSTCVPGCAIGQTTSTCTPYDSIRKSCYAAGYPSNQPGTCEQSCAGASGCGVSASTCAEGVCQIGCQSDGQCGTTHGKRTKCDLISGSCAVPCSSANDCDVLPGTTCSSTSATCVSSCSTQTLCPTQDSLRNGCVQTSLNGQFQANIYSCEKICTGAPTGYHPAPAKGSCPSSTQYCVNNPNAGTGLASSYCGVVCGLDTACSSNQTCSNASICSL